jgi:hypothetical protein
MEFGRKLLYNPCRRHIKDIPNRDVFHNIFGDTTAPYYPVYKKFRGFFDKLDRDPSKMTTITYRSPFLRQELQVLRDTCYEFLAREAVREDYVQLARLYLVVHGFPLPNNEPFFLRKPPCVNETRWTSHGIYCFDMILLSSQLKLDPDFFKDLKR